MKMYSIIAVMLLVGVGAALSIPNAANATCMVNGTCSENCTCSDKLNCTENCTCLNASNPNASNCVCPYAGNTSCMINGNCNEVCTCPNKLNCTENCTCLNASANCTNACPALNATEARVYSAEDNSSELGSETNATASGNVSKGCPVGKTCNNSSTSNGIAGGKCMMDY